FKIDKQRKVRAMPYPHAIRLRGPWQLEPLRRYLTAADGSVVESQEDLPPPCRTTVPSDWGDVLGRDFRGRARYRRSFQSPPPLDPHERVWLVVEGVDAQGAVALNGRLLGEIPGYALGRSFDVTSLLSSRNQLAIEVDLPPMDAANGPLRPGRELRPGGPIGAVRLEIRSLWYVCDLGIWSTAVDSGFVAAGRIAGEPSDARIAIVISGCQRELAYIELQSGESFEIPFEADDFATWTADRPVLAPIEVKLLGGSSSVWQSDLQTALRGKVANRSAQKRDEILADAAYTEFDRKGIPVIQQVPSAWAGEVCRRLAYHPSIIAWSAAPKEASPAALLYGRAWV
ncbi:MAG: glycosyl hydrolase 2 galactose-binding domain-containing protein, partial [Pirellulales bacterium]